MTTRLTAQYIEISAQAINPDAAPTDKIRLFLDAAGNASYIDDAGNVVELAGNAVRYDIAQALDPGQRSQARQNMLAEQLGAAAAVQGNLDTHEGDIASGADLGHIRVGAGLSVDGDGVLSADGVVGDTDFGGFALANYTVLEVAASITGTYEIDLSAATVFILTVTGDVTITFSNPPDAPRVSSVTIFLIQDATGSHAVTFTGAMWAGGTAPNLATAAGTETDLTFVIRNGGSEIRGYMAAEDMI